MPPARDVLLDTGPLVAALDSRDQWHERCTALWPSLLDRCLTTEAVVTEACHLALRGGGPPYAPLEFLLTAEIPILGLESSGYRRAATLMERFAKVPMDFADACLVALSEALNISTVFTIDRRGFGAYRRPRSRQFAILPER